MKKLIVAVLLMFASAAWADNLRDGYAAITTKNYPVALSKEVARFV